METSSQSRLRAKVFVAGIANRFATHPNLLGAFEGLVTAEAAAYFALNASVYPLNLLHEALALLPSLAKTDGVPTRCQVDSWLRWLAQRIESGTFTDSLNTPPAHFEMPAPIKDSISGLAEQILWDEYCLSQLDRGVVDDHAARHALSPNLISGAFTSDGRYVSYCRERKFLLPYPQDLLSLCTETMIRGCGVLISDLARGGVSASQLKAFVLQKHRIERAMLETILVNVVEPECCAGRAAAR